MLDGDNFLKAGWVHALKLHMYQAKENLCFLVMGKVKTTSITLQLVTQSR